MPARRARTVTRVPSGSTFSKKAWNEVGESGNPVASIRTVISSTINCPIRRISVTSGGPAGCG
jgi:hypothetical protein